jgi:hypothetical protein
MGSAAVAEELAGIDELREFKELTASEPAPEDEDTDTEETPFPVEPEEKPQPIKPDVMPHG